MLTQMIKAKSGDEITHKLSTWDPFGHEASQWFDPEWMFGVKSGFDVVIANPPYVRQELFKNQKEQLKNTFGDFFDGRADLYTYFYKRSLDLIKPGAILAFISSNKFFIRGYGENTRKLLTSAATPLFVINFGELPVFKAAVDSGIVIVKKEVPNPTSEVMAVQVKTALEVEDLSATLKRTGYRVKVAELKPKEWVFEKKEKLDLLRKLRQNTSTLNEYCDEKIFAGIKTGLDEAFVITEEIKERLIKNDPKSRDLIRPWLRGKDIARWRSHYKNLYVIYISLNKIEIDDYPAVKEHLLQFKEDLLKRVTQQKWYEMQQPQERFTELFDSPKIVYAEIAKEMRACLDTNKSHGTMKMFFIPYDAVILGVLNSRLFDWYARMTFATLGDPWKGGRISFNTMYMSGFPVPDIKSNTGTLIEKGVDKILAITKVSDFFRNSDKQTKVHEYEKQIDQLVYKLYGLTKEEIEIIEN